MKWALFSGALLIFACTVLVFRLMRKWKRLSWRSVVAMLFIAGIASTEIWLLAGMRWPVYGPTVIVATEEIATSKEEVQRVATSNVATQAMVITVERSPRSVEPQWRKPSELQKEPTFAEWISHAPAAEDPAAAIEAAERAIAARTWWQFLADLDWMSRPRILVLVGDRARWKEWQPVKINSLLERFRSRRLQLDIIEIAPGPSPAHVTIVTDLDLPADKPLAEINTQLRITVRSPALESRQGETMLLNVSGEVNAGQAQLAPRAVSAQVISGGALEFNLPLSAFARASAANDLLTPGFASCEMTIKCDNLSLATRGRAHLRVRRSHVIVVCGEGNPIQPLRQPSPFDATPPLVAQSPDEIRAVLQPLLQKRGGPIATYECMSVNDFAQLLSDQRPLPLLAVLHELSAAQWTPDFCKHVHKAVAAGLHLLVVDPPVRAELADATALDPLLPAYTRPDQLQTTPSPATIDRTACLTLVFDYNRLGRPRMRTNSTVQDGLEVQFRLARQMIENYRAAGVLHGTLKLLGDPNTPAVRRIVYDTNPLDRALVRVAPKFTLPLQDDASALGNLIVPSAMEMRLASVHADLAGIDRAEIGLGAASPGDRLAELWAQRPAALTNHTVLLFVHRLAPQPQKGTIQSPNASWGYALDDDVTHRCTPQKNADGMLAQLAARGVELAVIGLALNQDDGPKVEQGVVEMVRDAELWGKEEDPPLATFTLSPSDVLETKLRHGIAQLVASGAALTENEALATLLRSGGGPMFAEIDLMESNAINRAEDVGRQLADRWLPLHRAPRESMTIAVRSLNRAIDERIAPAVAYQRMLDWQVDAALAQMEFPLGSRSAAPQRIRILEANSLCRTPAISTCLYGISPAAAGWKPAPVPLLMNAHVDAGEVFVMAYSPLERGPESLAWDVPDRIFGASASVTDRHGPDRLIQLTQFLSRLRPLPLHQPQINDIVWQDARNGLVCTAEFLPAHTTLPSFFTPTARSSAGGGAPQPLRIVDIDTRAGLVHYELSTASVASLCNGTARRVEIEFLPNQPRTSLMLLPPPPNDFISVEALASVQALAGFSGGSVAPQGVGVSPRIVSKRWQILLLLVGLMLTLATKRATDRMHWLRDQRERESERLRLSEFDAEGTSETILQGASCDNTSKLSTSEQVDLRRIHAGDEPRSLVRNDLVLAAMGRASPLRVRLRTLQRTARVLIAVQAGRSMRLYRRGTEPKLQLAGYAAELIAHVAIACGAEVSLAVRGLRGDWQTSDVSSAATSSGELSASIAALSLTPSGPQQELQSLDVVAGTLVIYISDWLEEALDESVFDWAQTIIADAGQFAGLGLYSPAELRRAGWGWTPRMICDRTAWSHDDLRLAYEDHFDDLRSRVEQASGSFAVVHTAMTEQEVVAAIEIAELLLRMLQA